ncbi:hypothetical protein GGTG_04154 [Gaeumannomyces tritici R3-111a-1]|uniref:Uncharacterized protein n=1 Tax=Gaeumannomyces tritici (strain R3-111a-1) TaxID=644352 RepID=J3NSA9_GAET3|nr:hypothetical protein GGTG_04154 [Gaeumannomyces tritici R3-111a-1]EJT79065.1 hypothetical protein GGTG_04154 [Gaeumannomyces tritici R3-111a-1]
MQLRRVTDSFEKLDRELLDTRKLRLEVRANEHYDPDLLAELLEAERQGCVVLIEANAALIHKLKVRGIPLFLLRAKTMRGKRFRGSLPDFVNKYLWTLWRGELAGVLVLDIQESLKSLKKASEAAKAQQPQANRRARAPHPADGTTRKRQQTVHNIPPVRPRTLGHMHSWRAQIPAPAHPEPQEAHDQAPESVINQTPELQELWNEIFRTPADRS